MKISNLLALATYYFTTIAIQASPTPYCYDEWYHGYQDLGIVYTAFDTQMTIAEELGPIILGGSVPSGCSALQAGTYLDPQGGCAIIEFFLDSTDVSPFLTFFIGSFRYYYDVPQVAGNYVDLGVVGVTALKLTYDTNWFRFFGILELCSGSACSTNPTAYTA